MNSDENNAGTFRMVFYTNEFREFYDDLDEKVKKKIDYVLLAIKNFKVIHAEFVKKLVNTELYEMRVSVGTNEYRTILFAIDHENIMEATQVVILNGFLKKSSKDYDKQIKKAINLLNSLEQ